MAALPTSTPPASPLPSVGLPLPLCRSPLSPVVPPRLLIFSLPSVGRRAPTCTAARPSPPSLLPYPCTASIYPCLDAPPHIQRTGRRTSGACGLGGRCGRWCPSDQEIRQLMEEGATPEGGPCSGSWRRHSGEGDLQHGSRSSAGRKGSGPGGARRRLTQRAAKHVLPSGLMPPSSVAYFFLGQSQREFPRVPCHNNNFC